MGVSRLYPFRHPILLQTIAAHGHYIIRVKEGAKPQDGKLAYPWFLLGFVAMSILGSYGLGRSVPVSPSFSVAVSDLAAFLLTMAMTGLGLNISARDMRKKTLRPLAVIGMTSVLLSLITYLWR